MNLHRVTSLLFWFYKIVGLATFSLNKKKCSRNVFFFVNSKLGILYNFSLTCFIIVLHYMAIPFIKDIEYPHKTNFTTTIEIFQALLGCFMICFILLYFCLKQSTFVRTGNCLILASDLMNRLQQPLNRTHLLRLLIIAYIFDFILLVVLYISETITSSGSYWFHAVTVTPVVLLSLFCIQYFTVLATSNAIFVVINRIIKQIQGSSIDDLNTKIFSQNRRLFISSSMIQLLVQIRDLHDYVCDVSNEISRLYSLPMLIGLCFNFYAFLYNTYFFFVPVIFNESYEPLIIINTIIWVLFLLYPLGLVTTKVTEITAEVESTGNVVHALLNRVIDRETKTELKQFSLQLLHRKMKFTANGYFTLDNRLLQSLIGTVATYMVILVQFQMGTSPEAHADNCTQR